MVLARFLVVLVGAAALFLVLFSCAGMVAEAGGEVGASYGRDGNDLPDPAAVVQLLKQNRISMVRIYDANPDVLTSLAGTGIKVMVMLRNEDVAAAAADESYALQWVRSNVAAYPDTQINGVAVGNEVSHSRPDLNPVLVQAMTNVQEALEQQGLAGAVKVSSPIAFDALKVSSPPSAGRFKDDIAQSVMKPMLEFLQRTRSYLSVNLYPCLTYMYQPEIGRDFALGNPGAAAVRDHRTGLVYDNLLDMQLDATYFAMEDLGFPSMRVTHTEHGCASGGRPRPGHGGRRLGDGDGAPSIANAQTYMNNLMNRVLSGNTGTPRRPDADMDVYIFALFNENQKGDGADDMEANYGLFYPNMQKVYQFVGFGSSGDSGGSWCVANAAVGDARLQAALDYACGHGADCSAIQPGAACFEPNTKLAHASYAFNSYYQRNGRASGTCDFSGAAYIVYQAPTDTCSSATAASWCVANAGVGDARLQGALDYACGHGADCSAIQPGAACFEPNTKAAHASYAFNSYYQRNHRGRGTCDFGGAGSIVYQAPKIGNCVLPSGA